MSDSEAAAPPHPQHGGKSIESIQAQQDALRAGERPPYKSWRKKYRKIRARFDGLLEENKRLFKEEQKLEGLARRLREELDETMDILLDLNQNPAIAPDLRYDIRLPDQPHIQPTLQYLPPYMLPPNASPETANMVMMEGVNRVQLGIVPVMDLYAIRDQIQERLAQQDVRALSALEDSISHPIPPEGVERLASQVNAPENTGYLTADQESTYLARLDANINGLDLNVGKWVDLPPASPHQADLTPRELERQMELSNPQSQHSWLKAHTKTNPVLDGEESEPQALHEASAAGSTKSASRKKAPGKNLAKQVGDRAMEKMMREGFSPSAASGLGEEDDLAPDESTSGRRKKGGEKDPTFRAKGGKGGALKSKRKRVTDEGAAGGAKRMRASEVFE